MSQRLLQAVTEKNLVVCVGSGGVGKTTTAAALGIRAAMEGRRVLVITIDPARRLANALGLSEIGNQEAEIRPELFEALGVPFKGRLHAMMLDTRTVFDQVIDRVSPDAETRDRVLNNKLYRNISHTLSASQEYMAAEKLYDVYDSDRYDLIVLDTPPMKNALDFLDSPQRFIRFLDERIVRWFLKEEAPEMRSRGALASLSARLLSSTGAVAYSLLGVVFGEEFLDDLRDFFLAFKDLYVGFRERSEAVIQLLADPRQTQFVVVCSPLPRSIEEASYFHGQLKKRRLPRDMVVVNQTGRFAGAVPGSGGAYLDGEQRAEVAGWFAQRGVQGEALVRLLEENLADEHRRSLADLQRIEGLRRTLGRRRADFSMVPQMMGEVHDLAALVAVGRYLFPSPGRGE